MSESAVVWGAPFVSTLHWVLGCLSLTPSMFGGPEGLSFCSSLLENGRAGISSSFMAPASLSWRNKPKWLFETKVILLPMEPWLSLEEAEDEVELKLMGRSLSESSMAFGSGDWEGSAVVLGSGT